MHNFEKILEYTFKDINNLVFAMLSSRIHIGVEGEDHKEYSNEGLATVGDSILKFIIANDLYNSGHIYKGKITQEKELIEKETMHILMLKEGWINYSYNDLHFTMDNPPQHEKVVFNKHDSYVEAIVGAIFRDWTIKILIPLLRKYI